MASERLEEIRKARLEKRLNLLKEGRVPYPSETARTHVIGDVVKNFDQLSQSDESVVLVGRVQAIRKHGKVVFWDLLDATGEIQIQVTAGNLLAEFFDRQEFLDRGDFVQVTGILLETARGQKTLEAREWHMLSKSIRALPSDWFGLQDTEQRWREREVDLLLNKKSREALIFRSKLINWLRRYMADEGYLEVETPILQSMAGGAAAKPFITHHNALDQDLYLRIAAELPLKKLLVAGFEKVFEIERRFRNEGISRQHNPEFTMLESQWAYADYEDLMDFTEKSVEKLIQDLKGDTNIVWQDTELDFSRNWKRVRYVDIVSEALGFDILDEKEPNKYKAIFEAKGLALPEAENYYQLVDELYKELVRPCLIQPTLVYDYPTEMAPLAKQSVTDPRIAEKFQMLVAGMEINNCYTELNDPVLQRERLEQQLAARKDGDQEAHGIDEDYLRAMEYGMPPNAGWSLGIDRLVMLLTDMPNIKEVIAYPLLKNK